MLSEKEIEAIIDSMVDVRFRADEYGLKVYDIVGCDDAAHAIAEKMREGVVFDGSAELTFLYPSGKCAILHGDELDMEIMDLATNEEPATYDWDVGATYCVTVKEE